MTAPVQRVELTPWSILKIVGVLLGLYLLGQVLDVLALLFFVIIIVAAVSPLVGWLAANDIPRVVGVTLIYLVLFALIGILISLIVPPLVVQLEALAVALPSIVSRLTPVYELVTQNNPQQLLSSISSQLSLFTQGFFAATAKAFGGVVSALTVLVLSFYVLVDAKQTRDTFVLMLPRHLVKPISDVTSRIGQKLGSWLRGQVSLSVLIGAISYVGLLILGVPYALTLAVIAGILEIIPIVGPIIAGLAAILVAYGSGSWQSAVGVLIFYIIVQQLESNLLVPKVMQSAVGLSPVVVIIALLVGAKLGGITGAIVAVPLAAAISVMLQEWPRFSRPSP